MKKSFQDIKAELEQEKLISWRRSMYREILGPKWPEKDIQSLLKNEIDHYDLRNLLAKKCPKKTALKILL